MKTKIITLLIITIAILLNFSCNTTEPPPPGSDPEPELILKLDDVSCTEAWIELTAVTLQLPATIELSIDSTIDQVITLNKMDTLLYIDSLLPNTTYQFQASDIQYPASGSGLTVTTLEPTEHNINWQVFTFGEHGHSIIRDVAIIDENNIWAVGEIYLLDSIGQKDSNRYNAIKGNKNNWEIIRIPYDYQGTNFYHPIQSVYAFNQNDIWYCGNGVIHWNGSRYTPKPIPTNVWGPYQMNKIWGTSGNDIYVIGNNGNIAHYNGTSWQKMQTPLGENTDIDLLDIWGDEDGTIWTCGYSSDYAVTALLRNDGNGWRTVYEGSGNNQNNGFYIGPISGVWGTGNKRIYMMNWGGIYIQANSKELFLEKEIANFSDVGFGIDGTDDNNIFTSGEGFVGHWNGISYTEYPELYRQFRDYFSVTTKGNTVCAVGSDYNGAIYSQAVIAIGRQ